MKTFFVKKILPLFVLALSLMPFISCQDVIFDTIRKEVQLESGNIAGDIRSIVRFKDKYYLANGGIFWKHKDWKYYGSWVPGAAPNGQVLKLAADNNCLYALVGISVENEKEGTNVGSNRGVYYSNDGSAWNPVTGLGNNGLIPYNSKAIVYTYIFCTNSIKEENRMAYFALNTKTSQAGVANKVYLLDGADVIDLPLGTKDADTQPVNTAAIVSRSCVWYDGNVYFFSSNASTTNETDSALPTMYYYGFGNYLRWGGTSVNSVGVQCKSEIQSLGVTADYILVGTNAGITHNILSKGVPGLPVPFATNAESTLGAAYRVLSILVTNPELNETQTSIYASQVYVGNGSSNSAQFDHVGLWAYYPARGNWNRE